MPIQGGELRRCAPDRSGGLLGVQQQFQAYDLILQEQAPFLEPAQHQLIGGLNRLKAVDPRVQIGVFDPQFDQPTVQGM